MSCSHLRTRAIDPHTNFGHTLHCLDCNEDFRRPSGEPEAVAFTAKQLLAIAHDLREGRVTDYRSQRMDYAARRLEQMAEKLTVQWPQSNPWAAAVDEALIACCLGCTTPESDPTKCLCDLIAWHVRVATDPAVNGGFVLVKKQ